MFLSIAEQVIESENAWGYEVAWFQEIEVLDSLAEVQTTLFRDTDLMVDTKFNVLPFLFPFLYESCR